MIARNLTRLPADTRAMRLHHTKNKGDLGVLYAQLDLAKKGFGVLAPITEHEAFDLVAYKNRSFLRVQVKYRAAVRGVITLPFTTCWADRHGTHSVLVDKNAIDLVCLYCPDTDACYYLDPRQFGRTAHLRITSTSNGQRKGIVWAAAFTDIPGSVQGIPAGSANEA